MSKRALVAVIAVLAVLLAVATAALVLTQRGEEDAAAGGEAPAKASTWYCPMHPGMVFDEPGECPICHMALVPREEDPEGQEPAGHAGHATGSEPATKKVIYRSTMNPSETSDRPGKDSMGMEMVPVEVDEEPRAAGAAVEGLATVRIPMQKQQLIGVKTTAAARLPFRRTVRAVARVTYDETRLHHVHTKIAGYVEKLHVNATGEPVRQSQPLLEIYSPELLASQQEYLLALRARERTAGSSLPSVAASGEELAASARRRLELFDVPEEAIEKLQATGRPTRTITLHAPMAGTVIQRMVTHGQRVEPEMTLFDLADLSRVWVLASVYEYELPFVREGQRATMTLSYVPGRTFEGRVTLVYPTLDAVTRTAQVRLEFPNPDLVLKPDMYTEVVLVGELGERLAVPDSAVIETGARSVVFVDKGDGIFEPREVTIGLRLPDLYEVVAGLSEGERVITSGNFYVDSESKLKAALAAMAAGQGAPETPAAGHQH